MAKKNFTFNPLNNDIDMVWAGNAHDADNRFNTYYDYYFSGEDIKIFIDGLYGPEDELDIGSFAYSIRQEKQPLYGFWSYNYDAVMLGTRIISGEFSLFSRYPRRMTELLEKAARARATAPSDRQMQNSIMTTFGPKFYDSTEDEKNIEKYWANSQLDRITVDPAGADSKNIFSAHPPFNFVILFGVEETAISPLSSSKNESYNIVDNLDRMIYSDVNQRSVKVDNLVGPMKIVIQQVNLMSMSSSYVPGGSPVMETYSFLARDYYLTEADLSFVKKLTTFSASDEDGVLNYPSSSTRTGFNP